MILSHQLWQNAFGSQNVIGQTVEVNGLPREVIGVMPPGVDVMDNRTEIWMPLGLNPGNRQNRGSHFLYLIGRLKDGVTPLAAQTELTSLIQNWGERVGVKQHVFSSVPATASAKPNPDAGGILQMDQCRTRSSAARPAPWGVAGGCGLRALDCVRELANLCSREQKRAIASRRSYCAWRGLAAGSRQFMTEGVLLSIVGGLLGLVLARAGVLALIRGIPRACHVPLKSRSIPSCCCSRWPSRLAPGLSLVWRR